MECQDVVPYDLFIFARATKLMQQAEMQSCQNHECHCMRKACSKSYVIQSSDAAFSKQPIYASHRVRDVT